MINANVSIALMDGDAMEKINIDAIKGIKPLGGNAKNANIINMEYNYKMNGNVGIVLKDGDVMENINIDVIKDNKQ